jgi:salicylate hydroxylase
VVNKTGWWNGEKSQVYCAQVDNEDVDIDQRLFEISVTSFGEPEVLGETVIWGVPATSERVLSRIAVQLPSSIDWLCVLADQDKDFDASIKEAVAAVPEGYWKEFARFSGPRLETMTEWDKVALIGDAAHPLTGQ